MGCLPSLPPFSTGDLDFAPSTGFCPLGFDPQWLGTPIIPHCTTGRLEQVKAIPTDEEYELRYYIIYHIIWLYLVGGLEHEFYDFPFSWEQ